VSLVIVTVIDVSAVIDVSVGSLVGSLALVGPVADSLVLPVSATPLFDTAGPSSEVEARHATSTARPTPPFHGTSAPATSAVPSTFGRGSSPSMSTAGSPDCHCATSANCVAPLPER